MDYELMQAIDNGDFYVDECTKYEGEEEAVYICHTCDDYKNGMIEPDLDDLNRGLEIE